MGALNALGPPTQDPHCSIRTDEAILGKN